MSIRFGSASKLGVQLLGKSVHYTIGVVLLNIIGNVIQSFDRRVELVQHPGACVQCMSKNKLLAKMLHTRRAETSASVVFRQAVG